jgi:hypothetical protein
MKKGNRDMPLSKKEAFPGILLAILFFSALVGGLTACNLRPISRSLTQWGYMDTSGQIVIPMQYQDGHHFSEGLAGVKIDGKWGFINREGGMVIEPRFEMVRNFKEGRALVKVAEDSGKYIDRTGKIVIDHPFEYSLGANDFGQGLAAVFVQDPDRFGCLKVDQNRRKNFEEGKRGYIHTSFCGRWGYIDQNGAFLIEPKFIEAHTFSEGLAAVIVKQEGEPDPKKWPYGYINQKGELVISPRFQAAFDFSEGLARVVLDGRKGFIDQNGRWIGETAFEETGDFHEGLAQVKIGGRWGFIDKTGRMAIPAEFTKTGRFSEGLASASRSGKLGGYIDRSGQMVIPEQFGVAWPFSDGLARVQIGDGRGIIDTWGYIDKTGKVVIRRLLKGGWPFREGLALVGNGGLI